MSAVYNDRFILLPSNTHLSTHGLQYQDLLTYLTIRSFNNGYYDKCIPSLNTISDRSGMNKKTIIQSISRLERSGIMKVTRSDKARISNAYSFPKCEGFQQIPYGIFDAEDLKYHQKAMLIFMRQLFDSYNLESFQCNLGYWADRLGISYRTLYTQYAKLIAKGYLEKVKRKSQSGHKQVIIRLTDKLNWRYYRSVPDRKPLFVEDHGLFLFK